MYESIIDKLLDVLHRNLDADYMQTITRHCENINWPAETLDELGNRIAISLPAMRRQLPDRACTGITLPIPATGIHLSIGHWKAAEAAQLLLLAYAIQSHTEWSTHQIINIAYQYGDDTERCALLKGLCWLDSSGDMALFAADAGRTNSTELFAALALGNPYPALHYSNAQYNQLIVKALFMGLDISSAIGLRDRSNSELTRMCGDYIAERLAAGREVPASIWLAVNPADFQPETLDTFITYMCNNDPAQRFHTAQCLSWRHTQRDRLLQAVEERLEIEENERIREMLNQVSKAHENSQL